MERSMDASAAVRRLPAICDALIAQGMEPRNLIIEPPASTSEVAAIEERIGRRIPDAFRRVLTSVSRRVNFHWTDPRDTDPRERARYEPFHQVRSGELTWSLTDLPLLLTHHQEWIEGAFAGIDDDPDVLVWHNKFPFMAGPTGDMLAIDLDDNSAGRVVYLSHDAGGKEHGLSMAPSFEELLVRWIPLACAGSEAHQWVPFYSADADGIDPTSELAQEWIQRMNLDHDPQPTT